MLDATYRSSARALGGGRILAFLLFLFERQDVLEMVGGEK